MDGIYGIRQIVAMKYKKNRKDEYFCILFFNMRNKIEQKRFIVRLAMTIIVE